MIFLGVEVNTSKMSLEELKELRNQTNIFLTSLEFELKSRQMILQKNLLEKK